eukprot:CAMPEP_0172492118 /NCGR_PEP_ID=MMETSP1066-20121228/23137_1 /TAXON_ID=671091 /ORGANISM="Coscinodiscus wailesii, Strain CCMP2513" /LENGTH=185 /DNA_ID=CAMNT_0013261551 /DNA_START=324 /DNA_END=881 /DNA_ORIENTATION=+
MTQRNILGAARAVTKLPSGSTALSLASRTVPLSVWSLAATQRPVVTELNAFKKSQQQQQQPPPQKKPKTSLAPSFIEGYNDDAFGLILLSSIFAAKDYTFSAIFIALSFAAVVTSQREDFVLKENKERLAGFVACLSFVFGVGVNSVLGGSEEGVFLSAGQMLELGTCLISLIWVFLKPSFVDGE